MTWLRSVERLSRSGPSEVADAHLHLRELVGAAQALLSVAPPSHRCGGDRCPFGGHAEADRLCALVPRLAALDIPALPVQEPGDPRIADAFVAAVADAADTVRWCRQTAHPGGSCWFSTPDGSDCGEILKLCHRLS